MIIEKNNSQSPKKKNRFNCVRNNFLIYDPWAGKQFGALGGCLSWFCTYQERLGHMDIAIDRSRDASVQFQTTDDKIRGIGGN